MYVEKNIISPLVMQSDEELGFLFFHKRDAYDKMNHGEVIKFLDAALKQASNETVSGKYNTVDQAVKPIISKARTRTSYEAWKKESYPRKYFIPGLAAAENEVFSAKKIIYDSATDPTRAASELADANFIYVKKSVVAGMMKQVTATTQRNGAMTTTGKASIGGGVVEWAKNNKTAAIGLSAASVIGIFYLANKNNNKPAQEQTLKGLKLN